MNNFRQRHIAIQLIYDGRNYAGFAAQNVDPKPIDSAVENRFSSSGSSSGGGSSSGVSGSSNTPTTRSPSSLGSTGSEDGAPECTTKRCPKKKFDHNLAVARLNTVEHELINALRKTRLFGLVHSGASGAAGEINLVSSSGYSRCGRTDRGVSAVGQVVALPLRSAFPKDMDAATLPAHPMDALTVVSERKRAGMAKGRVGGHPGEQVKDSDGISTVRREVLEVDYCSVLNNVLPTDVRAVSWAPVSDRFSARFSAASRTYRYFFVRGRLNLDAMHRAAAAFEGDHDFRNFCKQDNANVSNFRRIIKSFTLHRQQSPAGGPAVEDFTAEAPPLSSSSAGATDELARETWYFQIEGQAFLWHQVRCMVAVLFFVGRGLEDAEVVSSLLNVSDSPAGCLAKPQYVMASEEPLVLHHCGFENLNFGHSPEALWKLCATLQEQWEAASLDLARKTNALEYVLDLPVRRRDVLAAVAKRPPPIVPGGATSKSKRAKRAKLADPADGNLHTAAADAAAQEGLPNKDRYLEMSEDKEDKATTTTMREALKVLGGVECAPGKRRTHVPLLKRQTGMTVDEKVASLAGRQKMRRERHDELRKDQEAADFTFFMSMRSEGVVGSKAAE